MINKLWQKYEDHLLNEGVTKKRINKLRQMYKTSERGLNKDFSKVTREDIETFVTKLHKNEFKRRDGNVFSGSSKSDIKKFLKQFWKWFKGNNEAYPKEVAWLKTKIAKDERPIEKPILSVEEVRKLSNSFQKPEFRLLTLMLFDSGYRIQEILSAKKKNLTWEEIENNQKCFWLECNESKTMTRKIPIPLFTEDIKLFSNSSYLQGLEGDDLLFNVSYASYVNHLKEHGLKLFNKNITPHCLRHSSATLYAKELDGNVMALCQRYGWAFNSKEVALYVRRSGVYQRQTAKKVFSNELVKVREELDKLREKVNTIENISAMAKLLTINEVRKLKKLLKKNV